MDLISNIKRFFSHQKAESSKATPAAQDHVLNVTTDSVPIVGFIGKLLEKDEAEALVGISNAGALVKCFTAQSEPIAVFVPRPDENCHGLSNPYGAFLSVVYANALSKPATISLKLVGSHPITELRKDIEGVGKLFVANVGLASQASGLTLES